MTGFSVPPPGSSILQVPIPPPSTHPTTLPLPEYGDSLLLINPHKPYPSQLSTHSPEQPHLCALPRAPTSLQVKTKVLPMSWPHHLPEFTSTSNTRPDPPQDPHTCCSLCMEFSFSKYLHTRSLTSLRSLRK